MTLMIEYAKLELKRNRVLTLGMAASFAASIPLFEISSRMGGYPPGTGLTVASCFWAVGVPLLAVLFGASCGAALSADESREAEGPLPISPTARASAALAANFGAFVLVSIPIVIFGLMRAGLLRDFPFSLVLKSNLLLGACAASLSLAIAVAAAFAFAYWIGNGILGGVLGLAAAGALGAGLAIGLSLQWAFAFQADFYSKAAFPVLFAAGGTAWAALAIPAWLDRRANKGWVFGAAVLAALLGGGGACWASVGAAVREIHRALVFVQGFSPPAEGVLMSSLGGQCVWIGEDGTRTVLVPARPPGLMTLLDSSLDAWAASVHWDRSGTLWVLRRGESAGNAASWEIWRGTPEKPLDLFTSFSQPGIVPHEFVEIKGKLELAGMDISKNWLPVRAAMPSEKQAPLWRVAPPPVQDEAAPRTNPDGSAVKWLGERPDGRDSLMGRTRSGKRFGPVTVALGDREKWIVGVADDRMWFVDPGFAAGEIALPGGELIRRFKLPQSQFAALDRGENTVQPSRNGFFYHTGKELLFFGFDGSRKSLGRTFSANLR